MRLWRRFLYDFVMNSNVSALHLMPAMWILGYFFTVVVYFTSVLPLTGHYTTGTMFMFFLLISVAIVYYRLYSGDPGECGSVWLCVALCGCVRLRSLHRRAQGRTLTLFLSLPCSPSSSLAPSSFSASSPSPLVLA